MGRLIAANLIWAFSFSFIGHYVSGKVDLHLGIFIRLFLGLLVWLPFFRLRNLNLSLSFSVVFAGLVQIGLMYLAYYNSFAFLSVPEVALFTVTTPLYISIINSLLAKKIPRASIASALVATLGALIIKWTTIGSDFVTGLLLVQLANICFATGQVFYRRKVSLQFSDSKQREFFSLFYLGACLPMLPFLFSKLSSLSLSMPVSTAVSLAWLGLAASGVAYYLWSTGMRTASIGQVAVMNNVLVPLAILVNLLIWQTKVDWPPFIVGACIIGASLVLEKKLGKKFAEQ